MLASSTALASAGALAEQHVALVIGHEKYESVQRLNRAANDGGMKSQDHARCINRCAVEDLLFDIDALAEVVWLCGEGAAGSGNMLILQEVADEVARRLVRQFLPDSAGRHPVFGENTRLQTDPHFKDHLLLHEYFHGDNGRGMGAMHQTGWTGLVAALIDDLWTAP
jgi:hypothetical protein